MLFPVDPAGDQRVRAGKKYEPKGRGGREAFIAADTTGHGTVFAAVAETPFRFDQFEKNGHWDYGALDEPAVQTDPEAGLIGWVSGYGSADRSSVRGGGTARASGKR